jgi:D-alanyl-lipoteichoic acid acyltransferase DltB (MBOAT superfamily)
MSNNYSGVDFWKSWHCSYNLWLIRYIYIPLGGKHSRTINSFVIFTFVALWHDTRGKLLAWGWLIVLFITPELVAVRLFCTPQMRLYFGKMHLHICALGGTLSVLLMMMANLIGVLQLILGFAVGVDGFLMMVQKLFSVKGNFKLTKVSSFWFRHFLPSLAAFIECFSITKTALTSIYKSQQKEINNWKFLKRSAEK